MYDEIMKFFPLDYSPNKTVLENLNLYIRPGEEIEILGRSRSGKTTLLKLLLRLYDV